jgi:transcriptional regulator of acetoin/glycerol metabolism
MARGEHIDAVDLALHGPRATASTMDDMSLEAVEAILIRKALARVGGNVSQAAEALGLSRGALYRRIEKYGL